MPSLHCPPSKFAAIDKLHLPVKIPLIKHEETLQAIRPLDQQWTRSPTPPTQNNFEFPAIFDCLTNYTFQPNMPPLNMSSIDEMVPEDLDYLHQEVNSETVSLSTEACRDAAKLDQRPGTPIHNDDGLVGENESSEDTIEAESYSLARVVEDARLHFGDEKPEFCVTASEHVVKTVKLSGGNTLADIHFRAWNKTLGYWVLTDRARDSYIIKYVKGKYFLWEGVDAGLSAQPVAYPIRGRHKSLRADFVSSQLNTISNPKLRRRTVRQSLPYTIDSVQKNYDSKGVRLSEAELEKVVIGFAPEFAVTPSSKFKEQKTDESSTTEVDVDRHSCSASSRRSTTSQLQIVTEDQMYDRTTLRTKFEGFDRATIPLPLRACPSHRSFFATIKDKWAFQLTDRKITYCIVSFPWLEQDRNILLQEGDEDSLSFVVEEVRQAPCWHTEGRAEVIVTVFAQPVRQQIDTARDE